MGPLEVALRLSPKLEEEEEEEEEEDRTMKILKRRKMLIWSQ